MAVPISKGSSNPVAHIKAAGSNSHGVLYSFSKSNQPHQIHITSRCIGNGNGHLLEGKINYCEFRAWNLPGKKFSYTFSCRSLVLCFSNGTHHTERKDYVRTYRDPVDVNRSDGNNEDKLPIMPKKITHRNRGLAEACRFACNDAKFVNERARNDMVLLSRGIMRLDARARQDVAMLGSEFIKLDARAREDTELIDRNVKKKAERFQNIAANFREMAHSSLKSAADEHWSDGALEADLRRADRRAKQRAMEDALMALEFVKNIHDMMVSKMNDFPLSKEKGSSSVNYMTGRIMLEKNGKTTGFFPGEVSADRITAIQEIYYSMAAALSEADGIDYTDPEELELLITTLIDLDAMDGKSSVSLLAECSSSPDVNTRRALANALAAAPSMWTLGNAGMGALQRLAEDNNPTIASAASNAIYELKKQWEIEEGDSWQFTMNRETMEGEDKSGEGR